MKFFHEFAYDASPKEVHTMLADPAFREKVCLAQEVTGCTVTIEPAGEGMSVVVDSTRPADGIPSFAKKIVGDEIQIVQSEDWSDAANAALDVAIPGKPGHLKGRITLAAGGSGTVETVAGDLKVSIPLLGGKLEGLIGDMLGAALRTESRVGKAWLAGER